MLNYCDDYSSNWISGWAMRRHLMFAEVSERMKALLASKEKNGCPAGRLMPSQIEAHQAPLPLVPESEGRCLPGCVGEPALANPDAGRLAAGNDMSGQSHILWLSSSKSFLGQMS